MQSTTASSTAPDNSERNRAGLATADAHWFASAITTGEFAMQAVGRLLLQDIAGMRSPSVVG
jgi:hypothetical protein